MWRLALVAAAGFAGLGLVAAAAAEAPLRPAVAACAGSAAIDFACHERYFRGVVRRDGAVAALRALAAGQRRNGFVRAACHQLAHRVGRAAGTMDGIQALADGRSVCASGYYHGVLQSVMGKVGRGSSLRDPGAICATTRSGARPSNEHYNCVHGMGHGFMEVSSNSVFASLDGCRALDDRWEQDECSGGVFMENVTAIDHRRRPSRSLRPREPLYPCTAVASRFWEQCYDWQVTYALFVNDSDFRAVFGLCAERPAGAARRSCQRGLGGDALQQSKFLTSAAARRATLERLCALGPERPAREACIEGAVHNMYRDYVDGDAQARALCRGLRGADARTACRRAERATRRTVSLPEADHG